MDVHNARGNTNGIKIWADYLFLILDNVPENVQFPISEEDIHQKIISSVHEDIVLEEDDEIYEKDDKFKSFHHQAKHLMSRRAILAGFLSVWLKKCVVPSPPHDGILSWALLPAVQLAHGKPLGCFPPWSVVSNMDFEH